MSLVKYEPSTLINRLRDQLGHLYEPDYLQSIFEQDSNVATSKWMPSVDIKEEEDRYIFLADIPGVDPKDIEVTSENGSLTIKGERESESKEEREGYKRVERSSGSFYRRFTLPDSVDTDHINAHSKNGVLEITVPKSEKVKPKKIAVEASTPGKSNF